MYYFIFSCVVTRPDDVKKQVSMCVYVCMVSMVVIIYIGEGGGGELVLCPFPLSPHWAISPTRSVCAYAQAFYCIYDHSQVAPEQLIDVASLSDTTARSVSHLCQLSIEPLPIYMYVYDCIDDVASADVSKS